MFGRDGIVYYAHRIRDDRMASLTIFIGNQYPKCTAKCRNIESIALRKCLNCLLKMLKNSGLPVCYVIFISRKKHLVKNRKSNFCLKLAKKYQNLF